MRGFYLHPANDTNRGCRGGVGYSNGAEDYELEVGVNCTASSELIAICVLKDEILEFLAMQDSNVAKLILATYHQKVEEINNKYEEKRFADTGALEEN
jgi:hypothetical protein|tara:strand:+ start:146 stop:439 length:294 start_codon:yes stop_codon:yes gene_type:complete